MEGQRSTGPHDTRRSRKCNGSMRKYDQLSKREMTKSTKPTKTLQSLVTHEKSRWGSGGKVKDQTKNDMRVTSTKRKALKLYGNRRSRRYEPQSHCGASHRTVLAYYCHAIAVCRNCLVPSLGYSSFKSSQVVMWSWV